MTPDKRAPAVTEPQIESVVAWERIAGQIVATMSRGRTLCAGAAGGPLADALHDRGVESSEMKRLQDCPSIFSARQRERDHLIGTLCSIHAEIDQLEADLASITESPGWIAVSCYRQWHKNKISNRRWLHQPYELLAGYLLRTFKLLPGLRSLSTSVRTVRNGRFARSAWADVLAEERPSFKFALLISGCPGDSQRYRNRHQAEQLELLGLSADSAWFDTVDYESAASRYELFILHRVAYTPELKAFILRARALGKPVIFDTDDLIFNTALAEHIKAIQNYTKDETERYLDGMRRHYETMSLCSAVLVSTQHLRNSVLELFPEMPVHINRNAVSDIMTHQAREALETMPAPDDGPIRIAYFSGSRTHQDDFEECAPALARLLRRHPAVRLMLVGHLDVPECLRCFSARIEIQPLVPWEELPSLLSRTSINLAPLEMNNPFTASKSELKYFEAGLLGIPTVASSVPAFQDAIRHGENGFLCSSTTEWMDALDRLITDSELRARIGNSARNDVLRRYTTRSRAPEFRDTLAGILSMSTRSRTRRFSAGFVVREPAMDTDRPVFAIADYLTAQGHEVHLCVDGHVPDCDVAIATDFLTAHVVAALPNTKAKAYLMEDYEPDFFSEDDPRRIEASLAHDFPLKKIAIGERLALHVARLDRLPVPYIEFPLNGRIYRNLHLRCREEAPIRILVQVPRLLHARTVGVEALYRVLHECSGAEIVFYGMPMSEDFGFPYESLGELAPDQAAQAMNRSHIHLSFLRTAASASSREAMACGCAMVDVPVANIQLSKDDWRLLPECKPKALADVIKRLVNEPELRRSLSGEAESLAARLTGTPDCAHRDFERILLSHLFMEAEKVE
jgi:glycosyltransferase involved in cell wall biosynthesis